MREGVQLTLPVPRQILALRHVPVSQPVAVLLPATLPRTGGIHNEDPERQPMGQPLVCGHLFPAARLPSHPSLPQQPPHQWRARAWWVRRETATDQVAEGSCASLDTLICSLLKRLRHNVATLVCLSRKNRAEVAQLVEHSPEKAGVDSSILSLGTTSHFPS